MSDPESSSNDTNAPDPRLLEELDEHIREARAAAEETIGYEGGPSFVESGEVSRDDSDDDADADDDDEPDEPDEPDDDEADDDDGDDDDDIEDRTDTDSTEDDQTIAPPG